MSKEEQKMNAEYVSIPLSEGDVVVQQIHSAPPSFARRLCRNLVLAFIAYTMFQMAFCKHHHRHNHQHHMRHHGEDFAAMHNGPHPHHHHHPGMMGSPHHGHHDHHGMMGPHGGHPHHPHGPHGHHPHGPTRGEFFAFAWGKGEEMDAEEESLDTVPSDSASSDSASSDEEIVAVPSVAREDFVISEESP